MRDYLGNSDPEKAHFNWQALREMKKIELSQFRA
jgi:hypothetical protein